MFIKLMGLNGILDKIGSMDYQEFFVEIGDANVVFNDLYVSL